MVGWIGGCVVLIIEAFFSFNSFFAVCLCFFFCSRMPRRNQIKVHYRKRTNLFGLRSNFVNHHRKTNEKIVGFVRDVPPRRVPLPNCHLIRQFPQRAQLAFRPFSEINDDKPAIGCNPLCAFLRLVPFLRPPPRLFRANNHANIVLLMQFSDFPLFVARTWSHRSKQFNANARICKYTNDQNMNYDSVTQMVDSNDDGFPSSHRTIISIFIPRKSNTNTQEIVRLTLNGRPNCSNSNDGHKLFRQMTATTRKIQYISRSNEKLFEWVATIFVSHSIIPFRQ